MTWFSSHFAAPSTIIRVASYHSMTISRDRYSHKHRNITRLPLRLTRSRARLNIGINIIKIRRSNDRTPYTSEWRSVMIFYTRHYFNVTTVTRAREKCYLSNRISVLITACHVRNSAIATRDELGHRQRGWLCPYHVVMTHANPAISIIKCTKCKM